MGQPRRLVRLLVRPLRPVQIRDGRHARRQRRRGGVSSPRVDERGPSRPKRKRPKIKGDEQHDRRQHSRRAFDSGDRDEHSRDLIHDVIKEQSETVHERLHSHHQVLFIQSIPRPIRQLFLVPHKAGVLRRWSRRRRGKQRRGRIRLRHSQPHWQQTRPQGRLPPSSAPTRPLPTRDRPRRVPGRCGRLRSRE